MSGRFTVETAHLSPKEEKVWFTNNAMTIYDQQPTSNPSDCFFNQITLDCFLWTNDLGPWYHGMDGLRCKLFRFLKTLHMIC